MTDETTKPGAHDEPTEALTSARPEPDAPTEALTSARPEPDAPTEAESPAEQPAAPQSAPSRRLTGAGALIGLLLVLLGFTLVVQLKSNSEDKAYASLRQEDLVTILADLDAREDRLQQDISALEASRRELVSGAASRDEIIKKAEERADDLGILAGTLPAQGPGVLVRLEDGTKKITANHLLNAVQELRGAGAEAIQIDAPGGSVRVIASTSFVDADGGIVVDGVKLTGPYSIKAIGEPRDVAIAMRFPGGVVDDVTRDGGNVIVSEPGTVDIATVRSAPTLEYAKPVS
ncbi:DUF881 domain-containing protein [Catellatospora tritici]|uniref:DUF881 domain-containing protein n=1 Tax=Catellatospora tritici TaxID=2851566 RepID=UPI001C2DA240|nr:DUF881 domain-containing protein [Catellatospora tritici]MBV1852994.1 DUF881 domain-containing protein [Catellatospora tritici]